MDSNQRPMRRVFLWTNPRSLGSIFLKCLSQIPIVKIANGLYSSCFLYGPDATFPKGVEEFEEGHNLDARGAVASEFTDLYDGLRVSYSWAKTQLENDYPGKKTFIAKDSAFAIGDNFDLLPSGFCHTFLIRHPYRMWKSWKINFSPYYTQTNLKDAIDINFNGIFGYKEQCELIEYLINNPELDARSSRVPIILDADDLQNHPESVLPQYCKAIGVPYTENLLHWDPGTGLLKDWKVSQHLLAGGLQHGDWGYFKACLESNRFMPSGNMPLREELDNDVLECADTCMPYYEKMYNMRTIRPSC